MIDPLNVTNTGFQEVTSQCFNWCKEQVATHQSNQTIENLFVIALAMMMLLLHKLLWHYDGWLIRNTELNANQIRIMYAASANLAFILLAIFIIYYTVLQ